MLFIDMKYSAIVVFWPLETRLTFQAVNMSAIELKTKQLVIVRLS